MKLFLVYSNIHAEIRDKYANLFQPKKFHSSFLFAFVLWLSYSKECIFCKYQRYNVNGYKTLSTSFFEIHFSHFQKFS